MNLRELVAILGHELRTPLAAIIGYQELLADGIYGDLNSRQREPLDRIQRSAEQILGLIDGLQELAAAGHPADDELTTADTAFVLVTLVERLSPVAETRTVELVVDSADPVSLGTLPLQRFLRAIEIASIAAIKSSNGRTLRLECIRRDSMVVCAIHGSALDPERDHPVHFNLEARDTRPPSAAQLRLAMATATLAAAGGSLQLLAGSSAAHSTLELCLPVTGLAD